MVSPVTFAKDGTTITVSGNSIVCSNGETFVFSGTFLTSSRGNSHMNVRSIEEAVGIVIGMHGGKRF